MTHVLLDTNVLLDVLLDRHPNSIASGAIWTAAEEGRIRGFIAAHAVTTIHYLARKQLGTQAAQRIVASLLRTLSAAPVDQSVLEAAMTMKGSDFEDNVSAAAGQLAGCEAIVTRDPKGFQGSRLRVLKPEALLAMLDRVP
jgi:predicted nucleic acid-binding protein